MKSRVTQMTLFPGADPVKDKSPMFWWPFIHGQTRPDGHQTALSSPIPFPRDGHCNMQTLPEMFTAYVTYKIHSYI